jgi:hypothetical protein
MNSANGQAPRNPQDVQCGREIDYHFMELMHQKIRDKYQELRITNTELMNTIITRIKAFEPKEISDKICKKIKDFNSLTVSNHLTESKRVYFASELMRIIDKEYKYLSNDNIRKIPDFSDLPVQKYIKMRKELDIIIQATLHIRGYELPRWTNIDRINKNLELRIKFMRNQIEEKDFKFQIQKKDKEYELKAEFANILAMYVACITDLLYRMHDNIEEYENVLAEMRQLRDYTNECIKKTFDVFGSKKKIHINDSFQYRAYGW